MPAHDAPLTAFCTTHIAKLDAIISGISELKTDLARMEEQQKATNDAVGRHERALEGNGSPGLKTQFADLKNKVSVLGERENQSSSWRKKFDARTWALLLAVLTFVGDKVAGMVHTAAPTQTPPAQISNPPATNR